MSNEPFGNLKLITWYHLLIYFGGSICLAALIFPMQVFDNQNVFLSGFGFFLFGLGVWVNERAYIFNANGEEVSVTTIITHIKFLLGKIVSILGITLISGSTYQIIKLYFA